MILPSGTINTPPVTRRNASTKPATIGSGSYQPPWFTSKSKDQNDPISKIINKVGPYMDKSRYKGNNLMHQPPIVNGKEVDTIIRSLSKNDVIYVPR